MPTSEKTTWLTIARIEVATWVLIFGGLGIASLGVFVHRQPGGAVLAAVFFVVGLIAMAGGVVLIVVRARIGEASASKVK